MNYLFPYAPALVWLGGIALGMSLDIRGALPPAGGFFLGAGTAFATFISFALIYS